MKNFTNLFLGLLFVLSAQSQPRFSFNKPDPAFNKAIEEIVSDFPYNYRNIKGELILAQGEWEQYASRVNVPNATVSLLTFYHSAIDTTASYQACLFKGESYEEAARNYKQYFNKLNHCEVKSVDGSRYYFKGRLEEPGEEKDFAISEFRLETGDDRFKNFKIELELLYKIDGWELNLNMVTRKPDDEQGPNGGPSMQ